MNEFPPPAIPLVTNGDCPRCGQPLLSLARAACDHCGRGILPEFEALPAVASRLGEMAPAWTVEDLKRWVNARPAELAWIHQNQQWPMLAHFVDEELWSGWQGLERSRRSRGRSLQVDQVSVAAVHLVGVGEFEPWVKVRVHGTRACYDWSLHSSLALTAAEPAPFTEVWTLWATGQPPSDADLHCPACGGENAFTDLHCRYCGVGVTRPQGPWILRALQVLAQASEDAPFSGGPREDWQWMMALFSC